MPYVAIKLMRKGNRDFSGYTVYVEKSELVEIGSVREFIG